MTNTGLRKKSSFPPLELQNSVFKALNDTTSKKLTSEQLRDLRMILRAGKQPNYEKNSFAFLYLYFFSNFLKLFTIGKHWPVPSSRKTLNILDLGCGSGASVCGLIQAISKYVTQKEISIRISAVDKSESQLRLFDTITNPFLKSFRNIQAKSIHSDAIQFLRNSLEHFDLIICSYLTVELNPQKRHALEQELLRHSTKTTSVIVVDSESSSENVSCRFLHLHKHLNFDFTNATLTLNEISKLNLPILPKYFVLPQSPHPIAKAYFECWRLHQIRSLDDVFSTNISYIINISKTLHGIEQVKNYWKINAATQSDVNYKIHHCTKVNDTVFLVWSASFVRTDLKQKYDLDGVMELILESGKIRVLREHYSKSTSPIYLEEYSNEQTQS